MKTNKPVRPMLATTIPEDWNLIQWPKWVSIKIDGIRCLTVGNEPQSRSGKPFRNQYIKDALACVAGTGLDGELTIVDTHNGFKPVQFSKCMELMSADWQPSSRYRLRYFVFDCLANPEDPFITRLRTALEIVNTKAWDSTVVELLSHDYIYGDAMLQEQMNGCIRYDYEGLILRDQNAPYKFGRATLRENSMLKWKLRISEEATITGFEQGTAAIESQGYVTELGYKATSACKDDRVLVPELGALIVRLASGGDATVGTGFTRKQREDFWRNRDKLHGKVVRVEHMPFGAKDSARSASFKGFRDQDDMDDLQRQELLSSLHRPV